MVEIFVRLTGGLGNQLFEYACGRALADRMQVPLILDAGAFPFDQEYRRVFLLDQYRMRVDRIIHKPVSPRRGIWPFRDRVIRVREPSLLDAKYGFAKTSFSAGEAPYLVSPDVLEAEFTCSIILTGYWQSELYFRSMSERIRADLQPACAIPESKREEAMLIDPAHAVCVGIRRYRETGKDTERYTLPSEYYHEAFEWLGQRISRPHFFLVCADEDRDWVESELCFPGPVTWIKHHPRNEDAYLNLWLMTRFQHFVLANSTYHWWGAWLSDCTEKLIVSPALGWCNMVPHIRGAHLI